MPFTVTSPFQNDETRTKEVPQMIEEFIAANWDEVKTGVDTEDETEGVAFGIHGNRILETGKSITLRAYSFFESVKKLDVYGSRREYLESIIIDIYVLNNEIDTARDPRAIKIKKWLDELFVIHQGSMTKGIYDLDYKGARLETDPENSNITRVKATVDVRYVMDLIEET